MNIYSVTDEDIEMMIITSEFQIACTDMIRNDWPFESREESETPLFYAWVSLLNVFSILRVSEKHIEHLGQRYKDSLSWVKSELKKKKECS